MGRIALAIFLILAATSGGAGAQGVPRSAVCTVDNSEKADIADIAAAPSAWMGKCVVVDGLYSDERVYRDVDAVYGLNAASLGGYIDGLGQLPGAWRGSFVGRVTECADLERTLVAAQLRAPGINLHGRVLGCAKPEGAMLMFMSTTGAFEPSELKRRMPGGRAEILTSQARTGRISPRRSRRPTPSRRPCSLAMRMRSPMYSAMPIAPSSS
jgi:hypothetical protein